MIKKHLLVTGGAGFIGSNLVDQLIDAGNKVTVLDDLSVGKRSNVSYHEDNPDFRLVRGSILDVSLVDRLIAEVDGVYHLAAVVGVKYVVDDPLRGMLVNVQGTEIILKAALKYRRKVLIASSSEAYGKSIRVPLREGDNTLLGPSSVPRWSYALSKLLDEHLAFAYYRQEGLPTVAVRYFNAYGPRLDPRGYGSVVARFITQARAGQSLTIYGDGEQTRSFTFVADSVRGTMAAMNTDAAEGLVFNIGNAEEVSINQLAHWIREFVDGAAPPLIYVPYAEAYGKDFEETKRRVPDPRRAKEILGFEARVPLKQGLQKTIQWFEEFGNE